jgi:hypothetical protein
MEGLIRKIVVGEDPKNGMAYYVNMRAGEGQVSAILMDEEHLFRFKMKRYLIYIERDGSSMLWKSIDSMPCLIEFDLNF